MQRKKIDYGRSHNGIKRRNLKKSNHCSLSTHLKRLSLIFEDFTEKINNNNYGNLSLLHRPAVKFNM